MTKLSPKPYVLLFTQRCLALFASAAVLTGCRTPATQIQLFIDTDSPVGRAVSVEVFSFVGAVAPNELPVRAAAAPMQVVRLTRMEDATGSFIAGGSIGVLPPTNRAESSVTLWIRATVAATATSPAVLIDRAARVSFVRGRSGTARVFLPLRCGDTSVGCTSVSEAECTVSVRCREQNATCGDLGECVAPEVPVVIPSIDGGVADAGLSQGIDATSGRADVAVDAPRESGLNDVAVVQDVVPDVSCGMGFELIDAECVPANSFIQPVTPISLGDVNVRRPTMRWQLAPGFDGAMIEWCADRACTRVLEVKRVFGSSTRPDRDLPARGTVFWRMRGTVRMATSRDYSRTWLFHVSLVDNLGGRDTSANPHLDVNGDGFDDVVVGARFASPGARNRSGAAMVFHGSMSGIAMTPTRTLEGSSLGDEFGYSVASAGDLNADGFGDLVVGAYQASPGGRLNAGTASVYFGSPTGVSAIADRVLEGLAAGDRYGYSVASAGDLNLDGYGDLVVGAHQASPSGRAQAGTASVYYGNLLGVQAPASRVLEGAAASDQFGVSVATAGDLNGDAFSDLVVGANGADPGGRTNAGTASVYYGGVMGGSMAPARVLEGAGPGDFFGFSVASAGDLSNDGFSDLVVGAFRATASGRVLAGTASVYHGSLAGVGMVATRVLEGVTAGDSFGNSVASARDLNGDGYGDLVVGAFTTTPNAMGSAGSASVFYGSVTGVPSAPGRLLLGLVANEQFGGSVSSAGDVNGDGFCDLVVGSYTASPGGRATAGSASMFYGDIMGLPMIRARILEGVGMGDNFGISVASVLGMRHSRQLGVSRSARGTRPM